MIASRVEAATLCTWDVKNICLICHIRGQFDGASYVALQEMFTKTLQYMYVQSRISTCPARDLYWLWLQERVFVYCRPTAWSAERVFGGSHTTIIQIILN